MPMAKKLFNEWWCKRTKDYRKDDEHDTEANRRLFWRAFCRGFYAAKELEDKTQARQDSS